MQIETASFNRIKGAAKRITKEDYQRMAHGVFWYGKVQKMNMNGPSADTTKLRSIFTQILA